jgi:pimeloyl-ACP methyl ester carboxylesterase
MKAAEAGQLSALVLAAPLPPAQVKSDPTRLFRLLRLKYSPLIFLRRPFRLQEKDFAKGWLSAVAEDRWPFALESVVPDAACLIKEFFHRTVAIDASRIRCPILILAGDQDPLVSPSAFEETASVLGGRLLTFPRHGHLLMAEAEGQKMVRAVHRWLVQELGEEVLLAQLRPDAEPRT